MKPATRTVLLVGAIAAHAFLSVYSFGWAFGIAHMHPDDLPEVQQAIANLVVAITWFPLLYVAPPSFSFSWPVLFANSTLVVVGGWLAARAISQWYRCRQQSHA